MTPLVLMGLMKAGMLAGRPSLTYDLECKDQQLQRSTELQASLPMRTAKANLVDACQEVQDQHVYGYIYRDFTAPRDAYIYHALRTAALSHTIESIWFRRTCICKIKHAARKGYHDVSPCCKADKRR